MIQPVTPPFSVTLSTAKPEVKVGVDIKVKVALTNLSDEQFNYVPGGKLDVRDDKGEKVSEIKVPPKRVEQVAKDGSRIRIVLPPHGSYQALEILPHQTMTFPNVVLNNRFDLSRPGTYTIQYVEQYGAASVKSNLISITVVP